MFPPRKNDNQITGRHNSTSPQPVKSAPYSTGIQSTQGVQDPPAQNGLSRPPSPVQASYSLQSAHSQQGNTLQREDDPTHTEDGIFLGSYGQPHNSRDNLSASPAALSPSSSTVSLPNAPTQQSPPVTHIAPPDVNKDESYAWFLAVDQDGNGQLSPEELRSALLNEGGLSFSASTVKYLMGIFDVDGSGTIGFDEFAPLWRFMTQWRRMFDSFDIDRDGRIDAAELGQALDHYNLHVGQPILNMLVNKYGITAQRNQPPGRPPRVQMDLDHFVCACVVVRQMCELYDKCTVGGPRPGKSQISRDQFLETVVSLP